jgi:hypothetical protein
MTRHKSSPRGRQVVNRVTRAMIASIDIEGIFSEGVGKPCWREGCWRGGDHVFATCLISEFGGFVSSGSVSSGSVGSDSAFSDSADADLERVCVDVQMQVRTASQVQVLLDWS